MNQRNLKDLICWNKIEKIVYSKIIEAKAIWDLRVNNQKDISQYENHLVNFLLEIIVIKGFLFLDSPMLGLLQVIINLLTHNLNKKEWVNHS